MADLHILKSITNYSRYIHVKLAGDQWNKEIILKQMLLHIRKNLTKVE